MKYSLNGAWELFAVSPDEQEITTPDALDSRTPIEGQVPGNIELDLYEAGWIKDPYIGEHAKALRPFEFYDFWYRKRFRTPADFTGQVILDLQGVDCFAEVFLNRKKVGAPRNALIPHSIPVTLAAEDEENELAIRIISPEIAVRDYPAEPGAFAHMPEEYSCVWSRKPVHSNGWDIAPRMLLGGLWKDVSLFKEKRPFHFREVWVQTIGLKDDGTADLRLYYDFAAGRKSLDGFTLKFTGVCVDSNFVLNSAAYFTNGYIQFELPAAKLWYPRGYGKPELYHLHAYLYDSKMNCVAEYEKDFGIRTIELERTDMNLEGTGKFQFRINGRNVRARGCNHVPFDALHSRDKSRTQQVLGLYDDLQCNMIRCWGGGVYESEDFYDFCDQHGIMVWQDFMLACAIYPRHPDFFEIMREEVEWVIRKYRSRTSLILWCGDNECDQYFAVHNIPFDCNTVTRKLLPEVLRRLDPSRPYLPCSPCLSEEALKYGLQSIDIVPERHIWGAREGFKLPYYSKHKAKFISETGWFGCPNRSALERFLTPEHCELNELDPEWDYHSSNPFGKTSYMAQRSQLIGKQIGEYFNRTPMDLDEYIKASQIFQAEALKFTIETARLDPECSGILWWNMIDCWPLFSDSVVDYYFGKKLSYHYIKRVLSPFCIMCTEPEAWSSQVVAVNDSSEYAQGTFTVECEGQILLQGDFKLSPGSCMKLGELPSLRNTNALWLIRWNNQGVTGVNHYISGNNIVDYHWYCNALPKIAALDNSFESEKVGC